MYRLRMGLCLVLGAAALAGCSDRNALTAPSARPLAETAALLDRQYTWSFTCSGDGFKASLNGSVGWGSGNGGKKCGMFGCWKESGRLTVDS